MSDYRPVDSALALTGLFQPTETALRQFDPALRLRKSANPALIKQGCGFILERKTRHTKPPDTATVRDAAGNIIRWENPDTRIATRDGYLVISPVHVLLMDKPAEIIAELKRADLADYSNSDQFFRELAGDQADADAKALAFNVDELRGFYRESFDVLDRVGDSSSHAERMRISNAGGETRFNVIDRRRVHLDDPPSTSAGETPAEELSDVHPPHAPCAAESGELHDQSVRG